MPSFDTERNYFFICDITLDQFTVINSLVSSVRLQSNRPWQTLAIYGDFYEIEMCML